MKLTQKKLFEVISNLRSELPRHGVAVPYPDENSIAAEISKILGIKNDDLVKGVAKQYKRKTGITDSTDIVIDSSTFTPSHPQPPAKKKMRFR